jgi:hypothetical protein
LLLRLKILNPNKMPHYTYSISTDEAAVLKRKLFKEGRYKGAQTVEFLE